MKSVKVSEKQKLDEDKSPDIAERIVFLRGKMTQKDFAQKIGINPNTLRNYETGRVLPNQSFLATLCFYLNVNPEWILLGKGKPFCDDGVEDIAKAEENYRSAATLHYSLLDRDMESVEQFYLEGKEHPELVTALRERNRLYKDSFFMRELYYRVMIDIILLSGRFDIIKNDMKSDVQEVKDSLKEMTSFFNKYKDKVKELTDITDHLKKE